CHHWNIHTEISIDSEKSTASFYLVVLTTPILVMIENVQLITSRIINKITLPITRSYVSRAFRYTINTVHSSIM
ncbi:hypothetical protein B1180_02115, partial [Enterococcus faecium]